MDRGPQVRNGIEQLCHRRFIGQRGSGDKLHARMRPMSKVFRMGLAHVGDVASSAGLQQGADHGGAERAGSAGDDHVTIAKIHESPKKSSLRAAGQPGSVLYIDRSSDQRLDGRLRQRARGGLNGPTDPDQRQVRRGASRIRRSRSTIRPRSKSWTAFPLAANPTSTPPSRRRAQRSRHGGGPAVSTRPSCCMPWQGASARSPRRSRP